jgi:hypothetical protein
MGSFGKRVDGVGGRRSEERQPVLIYGSITTLWSSQSVVLLNVSQTGAKLRGCGALRKGQDVLIRAGLIDALADVVWSCSDLCGITFEEPLSEREVQRLRHEGKLITVTKLTPEERLSAADWVSGFAR